MEWYDSYCIGIQKVDRQHKELVNQVSALQAALKKETVYHEVGAALKFLVDYTKTHFADEEEIMREIDFPELERHKKLHRKLIQDVTKFLLKLKQGKRIQAYDLIDFLTEWLLNHIKYEDQKIGKFFLQQRESE